MPFNRLVNLTKFDEIAKRTTPGISRILAEYFLLSYTALILITKLFLITEHFFNQENSILKNEKIQKEFFGYDKGFSPSESAESLIEISILLLSIGCLIFSKSQKGEGAEFLDYNRENAIEANANATITENIANDSSMANNIFENIPIPYNQTNYLTKDEKLQIYSDYKTHRFQKKLLYLIQFLFMAFLVSCNISLINLINFLIFSCMIVFAYFLSYKWLDICNLLFIISGYFLLIVHYTFNISDIRSKLTVVGMADFNSLYSIFFYIVYTAAYLVSCVIKKNTIDLDKLELYQNIIEKNPDAITKIEAKEKFRNNKNNLPYFYLKKITLNISKFSSFCYKTVLFILILTHICMLMLANFVVLFFGLTKDNKNFKKFTLIPTFVISCLFLFCQYVYNMSMVFVFENDKVYKFLEIIGIFKFYRNKLALNKSNIYDLEVSDENKFDRAIIDTVMILMLLLFTIGSSIYKSPQKRKESKEKNLIKNRIDLDFDKDIMRNSVEENMNLVQNEERKQDMSEIEKSEHEKGNLVSHEVSHCTFFRTARSRKLSLTEILLEKSYIISVVFLFICSTVKFDFIHVIYLILFLLLVLVKNKHFKTVWEIILYTNTLIIIFLYFWNILAMNCMNLEEITDSSKENIFSYLGLKIDKEAVFFFYYWEHITLYLFGYLQKFIINYFIVQKGVRIEISEIFRLPEGTRLITFGLLFFFIILLTLIKPCTFLGLIFLIYHLIFISIIMFSRSKKKDKIVRNLLMILLIFSVVTIAIKYLTHFDFVVDYLKSILNISEDSNGSSESNRSESFRHPDELSSIDESPNNYEFSLQDLELDGQRLGFKMFINAMLIILCNILLSYNAYNNSRVNQDNEINQKSRLESEYETEFNVGLSITSYFESRNELKTVIKFMKILCFQIIYLHSTKIMLFVSVIISFKLNSIIGVMILGIILFTLLSELKTRWKNSYLPLLFISLISILFIYICNLNALKKWMSKDYEWLGFYDSDIKSEFLYGVLSFLMIIFMCFISRISPMFKQYYINLKIYEIKVTENGVVLEERKFDDEEDNQQNQSEKNDENNQENKKEQNDGNVEEENREKNHNNLVIENSVSFSNLSHLNRSQMTIINKNKEEEEIIKSFSLIWIKAEYFWYLYGFYFVLVIIILIAFIKVNILSLIFMTFVGFQSFGVYKRCEYRTEKEMNNKNNLKHIRRAWIIFSIILSVITFLQYVNYMWFPPSWKVVKPWENFSFFCATEGKSTYSKNSYFKKTSDYDYCLADWKAWLGIDNYGPTDVFSNFVIIYMLLQSYKYLTNRELFNRSVFDPSKIIDFTIAENRRNNSSASKNYVMFIYLKSFILYYIIIISIIYSYKYTNLIYGGFLFISFYLLFKDAALIKHKNNLWKYVQYYNYLVLVGFMLFQNPFFPCPVNRDGRNYIGLEECVEEENRLYLSYLLYDYPKNTIDALYMVMVQTIGVLKLNFQLLIVGNLSLFLIYIVAIIQEIIYEHPYQTLVDDYLLREKQINCKSRAFKIVQDIHFKTNCEYRQLFTHMDGLTDKLKRLAKKIKKYENLWKQSNLRFIQYSLSDDEKLHLNDHKEMNKSEEEFEDKMTMIIEELFSVDKKLQGLIEHKDIKDLILKVYRQHFNENYVQENLKNEEKELEFKEFIIKNSIHDLKLMFATQFIKDRKSLYSSHNYGLIIANDAFNKIVDEPNEDPLAITTEQKEMEMLKEIFIINSKMLNTHDILEEREEENKAEQNNNNNSNVRELGTKNEMDDIQMPGSDYCKYIEKLNHAYGITPKLEKEFSYYVYFKRLLWKSIDKVLLIDLTINSKKIRMTNLFELFFFAVYSNVEIFLVMSFIFNHCMDASIMSMIYPISYFGYALLEYPFPNKTYWKTMIIYSLIIITIKLVYQFPFFCGYPFLSVFNIFKENYCEYYPLTDIEITSNFVYILGLRKYTGEYSYPKNDGLLSGIIGDIIILGLLLIMRSLLKSKGIWNFIDVKNEFIKVPKFTDKHSPKTNSEEDKKIGSERSEQRDTNEIRVNGNVAGGIEEEVLHGNDREVEYNSNNISNRNNLIESNNQVDQSNHNNDTTTTLINQNNINNNPPSNSNSYVIVPSSFTSNTSNNAPNNFSESDENFFVLFLKRVVPELFVNQNSIIYKPGFDYYPLSFAALLVILIYTLFFFGSLTGKSGEGIQDALDKQQFSKDLVWTVIIIMIIIVIDRIIYKLRSINNEKFTSHYTDQNTIEFNQSSVQVNDDIYTSNIALIIKLIMHYFLLVGTHILLFFIIPLNTRICFFNNSSLIFLYMMCCIYFYYSSKQLKYGFPLITKGQYFADSTQLRNRIAFKIYRNVPFLYELRAILDWTITKTSLDLFQWFKMEDAYATLYDVKCDMDLRKRRKEGEDRWWFEKISWGLCSFIFLMFILILPMILFSGFNPNLVENKVLSGNFKINLELKDQESHITTYFLTLFDIPNLKINNIKEQRHYDYLKSYLISNIDDLEKRKVQKVKVINYSQLDWILSPPAINALLKYLEKDTDCFINIEWEFVREFPKNFKNMGGTKSIKLSTEQISTLRNIIFAIKGHQKPDKYTLKIENAFPKVIRLSNKQYTYIKFDSKRKIPHKESTDIELQLIKENERDVYWKITQVNIPELEDLNDDVISSFFGFNSDGGIPLSIIGIYATLVFSVGKFIRFFFDKTSQRVIYEEMPNPKPLIELCEGVYIYRNHRMLKDEQLLYNLLIRIYRSPETLIEITGNHLTPK